MHDLSAQIAAATAYIRERWPHMPRVGLILGTGLGHFARHIEAEAIIPYEEVPHFPRSTVESHAGQLVLGSIAGLRVFAMEGRFHAYEGYSYQQITFPVRVMRALGAELLVLSNACGGLNPQYRLGDIMLMEDHINLMGNNPLIGPNDDALGPRFPDMCRPYDPGLLSAGLEIARRENIAAQQGVYVAVTGPNLETRAEYRFLRMIGADVVGMSTVPEALVAVHGGMRVFGLSVVTDMCLPDALEPASLEKILAVAALAEPKVQRIVRGILAHVAAEGSS